MKIIWNMYTKSIYLIRYHMIFLLHFRSQCLQSMIFLAQRHIFHQQITVGRCCWTLVTTRLLIFLLPIDDHIGDFAVSLDNLVKCLNELGEGSFWRFNSFRQFSVQLLLIPLRDESKKWRRITLTLNEVKILDISRLRTVGKIKTTYIGITFYFGFNFCLWIKTLQQNLDVFIKLINSQLNS